VATTRVTMAGTAYHMEALRKARVIERKSEAVKKIKDSLGMVSQFLSKSFFNYFEEVHFKLR